MQKNKKEYEVVILVIVNTSEIITKVNKTVKPLGIV